MLLDEILVDADGVTPQLYLFLDPLTVCFTSRHHRPSCWCRPRAGHFRCTTTALRSRWPGRRSLGVPEPVAGVGEFADWPYRRIVFDLPRFGARFRGDSFCVQVTSGRWYADVASRRSLLPPPRFLCGGESVRPAAGAYTKTPLISLVEEFGVASSGGVWVPAGEIFEIPPFRGHLSSFSLLAMIIIVILSGDAVVIAYCFNDHSSR